MDMFTHISFNHSSRIVDVTIEPRGECLQVIGFV
jgi:hypothetical protein